jgi:hypothetical protein
LPPLREVRFGENILELHTEINLDLKQDVSFDDLLMSKLIQLGPHNILFVEEVYFPMRSFWRC